MRIGHPRVWIAGFSAAAVLFVVYSDLGSEPPGPLSAVHERESDLTGIGSCANCHGGWFGSMTDSCLECHEEIAAHIDGGDGLHGALGTKQARRCALCHSEHLGADFALVNRRSFSAAGVSGPEDFDHGFVGFSMEGKHLELHCTKCHANAEAEVLPEGGRRYLGLKQDCASCHEDPHKGRMGAQACVECHGQQAWKELASRGHEEHLPLIGGHAEVACRECHAENAAHSLEAHGGGRPLAARECRDCHDSPHHEEYLTGVALLASTAPGASCGICHGPEHESFRDERLTVTPELHAPSGFALEVPHAEVACAECHPGEGTAFEARYPGREADACAVCHDDPHGGQFDESPFAEEGCVGCHDRRRFEPHAFTVEMHAEAALELTGRHRETECNDCHLVPVEGRPREFRGTPTACDGCHKDAHRGFFAREGDCGQCHDTATFRKVPEGRFDHHAHAGFAVLGAHAQARCESCHPRSKKPDDAGRTFGFVADHFGAYTGCATCHLDPHRGEFDLPGRPQTVFGKRGCERCHVHTSFRAFPRGFDHGRWTGFELTGVHKTVDCAACHPSLRKPDKTGRTWARAKGRQCADCHADPHAGQFKESGVTRCDRCHRSAMSFADLTFRHDFDARFRLGKAHEGLDCSACHEPVRIGKVDVVRYRPLGTRCEDCHDSIEDPFHRGAGGTR